MKDNLDLEVTVNNSTRPQLDERLKSLKQSLSERSDEILGVINSIDNDPQFPIIELDDMEFNLFDESGRDKPTLHQILQWNNVKNKVNHDYFDKDSILDESWNSGEWSDYVQDNCMNYDGESFLFIRDDWKYELQEDEERRLISDWIDI